MSSENGNHPAHTTTIIIVTITHLVSLEKAKLSLSYISENQRIYTENPACCH